MKKKEYIGSLTCENCINRHSLKCPPSFFCYGHKHKPYHVPITAKTSLIAKITQAIMKQ